MSTANVNAYQNTTNTPPPRAQTRLSDEQKTQVATILKDYDASNLSSEDALSIRQAFKDAKIAPGRDLRQAIENAGFSTDQLRPPITQTISNDSSKGEALPLQQLKALKAILENVDLSNLNSDARQNLLTQLRDQGLARSGIFVDISA